MSLSNQKCCICLQDMYIGSPEWRSICVSCLGKPEVQNLTYDPITKQRLIRCICGKIWNSICSLKSLDHRSTYGLHGLF